MEPREKLARLWEQLVLKNELNICTDRLGGTNLLDVNILRVVKQKPGVIVKEIITDLKVSSSTASSAIKRLEQRGLIARQISPEDLRSYSIVLTEEGQLAMKEHFEKEKELMAYLLQAFKDTKEQETFIELFGKIVEYTQRH